MGFGGERGGGGASFGLLLTPKIPIEPKTSDFDPPASSDGTRLCNGALLQGALGPSPVRGNPPRGKSASPGYLSQSASASSRRFATIVGKGKPFVVKPGNDLNGDLLWRNVSEALRQTWHWEGAIKKITLVLASLPWKWTGFGWARLSGLLAKT